MTVRKGDVFHLGTVAIRTPNVTGALIARCTGTRAFENRLGRWTRQAAFTVGIVPDDTGEAWATETVVMSSMPDPEAAEWYGWEEGYSGLIYLTRGDGLRGKESGDQSIASFASENAGVSGWLDYLRDEVHLIFG